MITIREAIEQAAQSLILANQDYAKLDAQVLLSYVLHVERSSLYTYPEQLLTLEQIQLFRDLIERRSQGEPVAYLVGHKEFYGLDFLVDKRVLIPRPETELLVDVALNVCRKMLDAGQVPVMADIGTGSGIIPITLAVLEPRLPCVYACDISVDALDVASVNCHRHHVEERVRLLQGDLLEPLPEPVDVVTANLPYVGTDELEDIPPGVKAYEPHLALFSGPLGLDLILRFFQSIQQSQKLKAGASLLLEIGYRQMDALTSILRDTLPQATLTFTKDLAGWNRVLQVTL
ncbi:MAG TPA: peptide chain release factor N(5)-glutamine methyltransferase [Ktedonobacteraceae bacterium]|nr:peptide chain release factor N(5)-glutamine methyltransferase [Ktedonobacteraceae bacterium]